MPAYCDATRGAKLKCLHCFAILIIYSNISCYLKQKEKTTTGCWNYTLAAAKIGEKHPKLWPIWHVASLRLNQLLLQNDCAIMFHKSKPTAAILISRWSASSNLKSLARLFHQGKRLNVTNRTVLGDSCSIVCPSGAPTKRHTASSNAVWLCRPFPKQRTIKMICYQATPPWLVMLPPTNHVGSQPLPQSIHICRLKNICV